jgi:hypothetical protein
MKIGRFAREGWRFEVFFILGALAGFWGAPIPVLAHHGEAAYDAAKTLTLRATMTEFEWANPHCELLFDVGDDKGNKQHWMVQAINPLMLTRYGWTRSSLKPGDMVTVVFHPAKNGEMTGLLDKVILANGRELAGRQSAY